MRPVSYDDRLSIVEHLDELRSRIIVCAVGFGLAFAFCAWQSDAILSLVNRPLERSAVSNDAKRSRDPLEQQARFQRELRAALQRTATALEQLSVSAKSLPAGDRRALAAAARAQRAAVAAAPKSSPKRPVTLGVAEPFVTTFTVAAWAALLLSLPLLLYQFFAFVLPAFRPDERQIAMPLMLAFPALFVAGVVFAYFAALPPAISFLQHFNDDSFDILVRARDYYRFAVVLMGSMGLVFEVPLAVLAVTRLGIVTPLTLRRQRRYAIVIAAVVAALITPSVDPVTMLVTMAPLVVLYELGILLATLLDRRSAQAVDHDSETTTPRKPSSDDD